MRINKATLILGNEGHLFWLLNSIKTDSLEEKILLEFGVKPDYLNMIRKKNAKVVLGKGAFGKVRFSLCLFGNSMRNICQLRCVKKFFNSEKSLVYLANNVYEDFFFKDIRGVVVTAKPLDMAIILDTKKGYFFMEVFPYSTADEVFNNSKYQKWEFQKPFILKLLDSMMELLLKNNFLNTDLKPKNLLYDPDSETLVIIDLGKSIFVERQNDLERYDSSCLEFGGTKNFLPPEFLNQADQKEYKFINLEKAMSYLCGATIANLTGTFREGDRRIGEKTDLDDNLRKLFINAIDGLLKENPHERLSIEDAIIQIKSISSDDNSKKAIINLLKK